MYVHRTLETGWKEAAADYPVLLLTGARQVGKTTLLRHLCEQGRTYVTLDDPNQRALATEDPGLFLQRFKPPVLIDEIQYAPELLPLIKMDVDEGAAPGAYWLTGSQQFHMMRGVSESLAGRVAIVNLLGLSSRERDRRELDVDPFLPTEDAIEERRSSGGSTTLERVFKEIWLGSFPAIGTGKIRDRDLYYASYMQTYIQRDVRDLSQVGDESTFLKFVRAAAARTGQLLNYSDLARDADVSVNTAKQWLSILQASMQVALLEPYHSNLTKRLVKRPKLYFLDTGLFAYLTGWNSPETLEAGAMAGAALETHVFAELYKSWLHRLRRPNLYYFRDRDANEIDFLFIEDGTMHPVEVKKSAAVKREWGAHSAGWSGSRRRSVMAPWSAW
jgi:predicted AAA+ superfamily ATPase